HTRLVSDWSSDVCSSDLRRGARQAQGPRRAGGRVAMLRATLKSLLARKLRLTLSTLAVVLSVMFVSGSLVLTDTLGRTFDNLFRSEERRVGKEWRCGVRA